MSILIYPHKFDACHLHYEPPVQNNDADDSKFSRIIYSTKHISLNGIGIALDLVGARYEQHYNKIFASFDPALPANQFIVSQLHTIERTIVNKYVDSVLEGTRRCNYSIADQLTRGCIKAYVKDNGVDSVLLSGSGSGPGPGSGSGETHKSSSISHKRNIIMIKICGVWETNDECGITYKFTKC
jgi:hypothetical protein